MSCPVVTVNSEMLLLDYKRRHCKLLLLDSLQWCAITKLILCFVCARMSTRELIVTMNIQEFAKDVGYL